MLTPQEVSDHGFAKVSFGGYNMIQVDEFLDNLTGDYTTLYSENTALKRKMKVMQDKIDEYRTTEETMRKALLGAQQMAENIIQDGKNKAAKVMEEARVEIEGLRKDTLQERKMEENRLSSVKQVTAQYVEQVLELHRKEKDYLESLAILATSETPIPEPSAPEEAPPAPEKRPQPTTENAGGNDVKMYLERAMADALGEKKAAELSQENFGKLQQIYQSVGGEITPENVEATTRFLLRGELESAYENNKHPKQLQEDSEYDAELSRSGGGARLDFSRLQQEFNPGGDHK